MAGHKTRPYNPKTERELDVSGLEKIEAVNIRFAVAFGF